MAAVVNIVGNWLLAWWNGSNQKLRKYEEGLIANRLQLCNDLLGLINEIREHLSPVAKGTRALEQVGSQPSQAEPTDQQRQGVEKTAELFSGLYSFVNTNALYLGKAICLEAIYYESGFAWLGYHISLPEAKVKEDFYTLCRWTWQFEDGMKDAIRRATEDAVFSLPSSVEVSAARFRGIADITILHKRVQENPDDYSIDARTEELRLQAERLRLSKSSMRSSIGLRRKP